MTTTPDPTTPDPTPVDAFVDPTPVEAFVDPAPVDPRPVDPVPVQPVPVQPSPVDPALDGITPDPTSVAGTVPDPTAGEQPRPSAAETAAAMRQADLKVVYAAAGATEALVGAVRGGLTETQRWATARLAELRFRRVELARQAEEMRRRAEGLPEEVKTVPEAASGRVADLQEQATSTYAGLADRGQRVLADVRADVVNRIDPAFDRLQARVDGARRALRGAAATPPAATPPAPATVVDEPVVEDVLVEDVVVEDVIYETVVPPLEDREQER